MENKKRETNLKYNIAGNDKKKLFLSRIKLNWQIYLMLLPVLLVYIIFSYVPMYGIAIAWKDYLPKYGILGSPSVGWEYFIEFFEKPNMIRALRNTLSISFLKLIFCFPAPIILALLLNEIRVSWCRKTLQWMMYLPYFISWIVIGGILKQLLAHDDGLINNIIELFGGTRQAFLLKNDAFYTILILAELWKGMGWGTVTYIASISGISPSLYEAATIDGAGRWGHVKYITLPSLMPLITINLILQIGNIMNAGFDPVYNLYNKAILEKAEIIDTLVYTEAMAGRFGFSTAVGLFKNVINFILLMTGNYITKKINGYSMYSLD